MANSDEGIEPDLEVLQRALSEFNPIVFCLCSSTPDNVNTDKIMEGLRRDDSLVDSLYVIDARTFVKDFAASKPPNPKSKGALDSKKSHVTSDAVKSPALFIREEFVKIALGRELEKIKSAKALQDLFESLKAQYIEDGMSDEEAAAAATDDMKEDEDDTDVPADDDPTGHRKSLFLCVVGFPNAVDDIIDVCNAGVPLDCLLNVTSKVALAGSTLVEVSERANDKARKGVEHPKVTSKKGKSAEESTSKYLIEQITQHHSQRKQEEYCAADEVLVHTYGFPCEELPSRSGDGEPVYRLVGSEKAGLNAIVETLFLLEDSLNTFREWKKKRSIVHVPKYQGLVDPDAPKPIPVEIADDKNKRRKSVSNSKKGSQPPVDNQPELPVLTTDDLHSMSDVAVNIEKYTQTMKESNAFSVSKFFNSCINQVSEASTTLFEKRVRDEKAMLSKKDAVGRFSDYVFREIMGKEEQGAKTGIKSDDRASTSSNFNTQHGILLGCEGRDVSETYNDSFEALIPHAIKQMFPDISDEASIQQAKNALFLGFCGLNTGPHTTFTRFWFYKNLQGWRNFSCKWENFFVDVLCKGDGRARTAQRTFSFEGPTTFPEYVAEQTFCDLERIFFNPPPAESDEEELEEEEEEEDEEDEEGNIIPRKKKEPEPLPFLDHTSIIQRNLRRRRINEHIRHHLSKPCEQETIIHGRGARCASEEIEWMYPLDGTSIEVERSTVNTKQLSCFVSSPRGLDYGFLFCESNTYDSSVQKCVPSNIRCFVEYQRYIKIMTEVVADNSVAAEQMAYELAVEEAKMEARKQQEALQNAKKSARGKDKATALPTLTELETACINAIPKPRVREKCPPTLQLSALINEGTTYLSFSELEKTITINGKGSSFCIVDLHIKVWRTNRLDDLHLGYISRLVVHSDGTIEVFSPQSQGYRVFLTYSGTYMSEKDNLCLIVLNDGTCNLRSCDGIFSLPHLLSSQNNDPATNDVVTEREDGIQFLHHGDVLKRVKFCDNIILSWDKDLCNWSFKGYPNIMHVRSHQTFGVNTGPARLLFDLSKNAAYLTCIGEEICAIFDFVEYRFQVYPVDFANVHTVDCAFGGMYANCYSPCVGRRVFRVSPFGRCSEEKDGLLVFPRGYTTPEDQPLMRFREIWSPSFVNTLTETDVCVERDALHLMAHWNASLSGPTSSLHPSIHKNIEERIKSHSATELKKITSSESTEQRFTLCICVGNADRTLALIFIEPSTANSVTKTFMRGLDPLYSAPFQVNGSPQLQEYLLAVRPPFPLSARPKILLPLTIHDLRVTQHGLPQDILLWYWFVKCAGGDVLVPDFFKEIFDMSRIQNAYEKALEFLCLKLPLAQRDGIVSLNAAHTATAVRECSAAGREGKAVLPAALPQEKRSFKQNHLHYWNDRNKVVLLQENRHDVSAPKPQNPCTGKPHIEMVQKDVLASKYQQNPLMVSKAFRTSLVTGSTPSSKGHCPMLSIKPSILEFGSIKTKRCYAAIVYLTNTSSVPCRYRVTVEKQHRAFITVKYPRHFMAAGLTEGVEVRILGHQPIGATEASLSVAHEGGSTTITATFTTVEHETDVLLSPSALCIGDTPPQFLPGSTLRFKRNDSDDFEEEVDDDSSADDPEV